MGLETGNFIEDLDLTWPTNGDQVQQGDDHLRLIKKVLKQQFPGSGGNGFASAVTTSEAEMNFLVGVTSLIQDQLDALSLSLSNNGSVPIGGVIGYNGLFANIAANFQLCDGTNGTPDMTDQFMFGTNTESELNDLGGNNDAFNISHTHIFTGSELPPHSHSVATYFDTGTGQIDAADVEGAPTNVQTSEVSAGTPVGTISTDGFSGVNGNRPAFIKFAFIRRMS